MAVVLSCAAAGYFLPASCLNLLSVSTCSSRQLPTRPNTPDCCCRFVEEPVATSQTFLDLQAELEAVFGAAGGGRLLTPREVREAAKLEAGADLAAALLQAPGSGPW